MKEYPILKSKLFLYLTEFFAGVSVMAVELGASRLLAPYFSASQIVWTIIIGVIMIALALGNVWGGRLADRPGPLPRRISKMFFACAAACLAILALNAWAGRALWLMSLNWPLRILIHMSWVFLLPTIVLGTISPMVAKLAIDRCPSNTGRAIGNLYAWNAVGSIFGTFLTGFYLTAHLGSVRIVVCMAALMAVLGLAYAIVPPLAARRAEREAEHQRRPQVVVAPARRILGVQAHLLRPPSVHKKRFPRRALGRDVRHGQVFHLDETLAGVALQQKAESLALLLRRGHVP